MEYKVGDRVKYDSEICTVTKVIESQGKFKYRVQSDTWFDVVEDEMIEGLVEEEVGLVDSLSSRWVNEFELPDGYIFKDENGNVINATKIVLEKKKKEYPKTYEECLKILGFTTVYTPKVEPMFDYDDDIIALQKLKNCRNAYWKIAGEEMGLGKPWKPDWIDGEWKWCMYYSGNYIEIDQYKSKHHTLAFPTEEMRDAFYENFKDLIEQCKELL